MTTRIKKSGRPPRTRDAIYAEILARPGEGLTSARLAEIVGCTSTAACENLRVLRDRGFVTWLRVDRVQRHFAPGPYRDLYAAAHKDGLVTVAPHAERARPAQELVKVEIIGMDEAKFTPAKPMPDHRYVVSQDHRGEFSALGIGRYAE